MNIGIVGATGSFGKGLALRWAEAHTVYIGSRSPEKGKERAEEYQGELKAYGIGGRIVGTSNRDAILSGDVIVLSVKYEHLVKLLTSHIADFSNKIVLSPVVAIAKGQCFQYTPPPEGSVALLIQNMLGDAAVISALHTIPAHRLHKLDVSLEGDVPICGDSPEAKETVTGLIKEIEQLNPIDAGPLEVSRLVEPMVPLILNIKQYGLKRNTSIKFI